MDRKIYFYRTDFEQPTEEELQSEIQGENFEIKYKVVKDALFDYLRWLEVCPTMDIINEGEKNSRRMIKWDKENDDKQAIKWISKIALFLSVIRGNIYAYQTKVAKLIEDNDGSESQSTSYEYGYNQPIIENASRANAVLYNVARAHAFEIHGRNFITREDLPIIVKIALSTANRDRVAIIKLLLTEKDYEGRPLKRLHTSFLMQTLQISKSTAHRTMKELQILGLVEIGRNSGENYINLREEFQWLVSDEFGDLMKQFDNKKMKDMRLPNNDNDDNTVHFIPSSQKIREQYGKFLSTFSATSRFF